MDSGVLLVNATHAGDYVVRVPESLTYCYNIGNVLLVLTNNV